MPKILDILDSKNQKFEPGASGMSSNNAQDGIIEAFNNPANMPAGGTVSQYIRKQTATDYDVLWETLKIADDPTPVLGGDLQTDGNIISIQDLASTEYGRIAYEATIDGVYLAFVADPASGVNFDTDGGVLAKAGELTLSGSVIELNAFKGGSENFQLYVSEDGILYGVKAPATGWQEVDTDNADYSFPSLGTWVQITGLFITVPQVVDAGDRVDAFTNLYFQNGSDSRGGSVDIGIGINGAAPTTVLNNVRIEAGFDSVVPTSITTTTHGGLAVNDTITVFVRRATQDHQQFDPQVLGSIDPSELIVSIPGEGGGGPGGDPTHLGNIPGPSTVTITSSTGSNTVIQGANTGPNGAGVMTEAQVVLLNSRIDATGVTYENLDANGDVGPGVGQLEPGLDNPTTDGFVLSSTIAGVRSWVAPGGTDLGTTPAADNVTITSSSGLDTIIPGATTGPTGAGVMTSAQVADLASKVGPEPSPDSTPKTRVNDGVSPFWQTERVVPDGGVEGQIIVKNSATEQDAGWSDLPIGFPGVWKFDSSTVEADPGSGDFRLNAVTMATATEMYISVETVGGLDLLSWLENLKVGQRIIAVQNNNVGRGGLFEITGTVTNNGNLWFKIPITLLDQGSGGEFEAGKRVTFNFTGLAGPTVTAWGEIVGTLSDQDDLQTALNAKEDGLGNPTTDGYLLSSTIAGVRSWVAPGSGGGIPEPANDTYGYVRLGATTNDWARGARVFEQATPPASPSIGDIWINTA